MIERIAKRIKFALTPKSRRVYAVQTWSISRNEYRTIYTGTQIGVEYYAYAVRFGLGLACRTIRIK